MRPPIKLTIPDDTWEACDDGLLLASVYILGVLHHLEAIPVEPLNHPDDSPDDYGATDTARDMMENLHIAYGDDGGPFSSVEIGGKPYCLFLSPGKD